MSAEIINLRQVRKQRERDAKAAEAAENRVRFGRTKVERQIEERSKAHSERALDGHRRETPAVSPASTSDEARTSEPPPERPR